MTDRVLFWFRRDLSLEDNLGWAAATAEHREVLPVFVLDPRLLASAGPIRRRALVDHLSALDAELRLSGGCLTVVEGRAEEVVPRLAAEHRTRAVRWNSDVTGFSAARDASVRSSLDSAGVVVSTTWSTLIHPPRSVLTSAGTVHKVFSGFHLRWSALPVLSRCVSGDASILAVERDPIPGSDDIELPWTVGPLAARSRLADLGSSVDRYDVERDRPDIDATSRLSADLRFGSISPREVLRAVGASSAGRQALVRQLAWRDWYAHLFSERPDLVDHEQQVAYETIAWVDDPEEIDAWKDGMTGYPIVDAGMRQLRATGWMHNRVRLVAASFLVKDLLVDWRIGERHFRRHLIDGDVPQNAGNWQWCAGTGPDAAPYFRVFNPLTQARRFDPDGDYVRRWVPELSTLPGGSIHAPWELGPIELAAAGVTIGDTYPERIIDHAVARDRALAVYGAARAEVG